MKLLILLLKKFHIHQREYFTYIRYQSLNQTTSATITPTVPATITPTSHPTYIHHLPSLINFLGFLFQIIRYTNYMKNKSNFLN